MARSRVVALLLVLAPAALLVACNDLLGLSDFERVQCSTLCPEAGISDAAIGTGDEAGAIGTPDAASFDGAVAATDGGWARWKMPNPDGGANAGWPNVVSYAAGDGGTVVDTVTHLTWSAQTSFGTLEDAATFCQRLGMRLPTRIELVSLIDFTRSAPPMIDPVFGDGGAGAYWTASPVVGTDGGYWVVRFDDGTVKTTAFESQRFVRCVR